MSATAELIPAHAIRAFLTVLRPIATTLTDVVAAFEAGAEEAERKEQSAPAPTPAPANTGASPPLTLAGIRAAVLDAIDWAANEAASEAASQAPKRRSVADLIALPQVAS